MIRGGKKKRKTTTKDGAANDKETPSKEEGRKQSENNSSSNSVSKKSVPAESMLKRLMVNKALGETALHRASRLGYDHIVTHILNSQSIEVDVKDNAGYTPLHEAASRGHVKIVRALLERGAAVDASAKGIRPLHCAVENDHVSFNHFVTFL